MFSSNPEIVSDSTPDAGGVVPPTAMQEHLAQLIFLSYRYSQGGIGTQNRMLQYIERHHQPNLFSENSVEAIKARTQSMVGKFFLNERSHPSTAVPWDQEYPGSFAKTPELVVNEVTGLFDRFRVRDQLHSFGYAPADIAMSVIVMDADYLTRPGGRAGSSEEMKIKVGPYRRDPFDSLYIKHAVLGITTHTVEFDDIFRQLATPETIQQLDSHTLTKLKEMVTIYIETHPKAREYEHGQKLERLRSELFDGER